MALESPFSLVQFFPEFIDELLKAYGIFLFRDELAELLAAF
jgi:hypothetical protein